MSGSTRTGRAKREVKQREEKARDETLNGQKWQAVRWETKARMMMMVIEEIKER